MICSVVLMLLILALLAAYTLKPDHGGGIRAAVVTDFSGRLRTMLDRIATTVSPVHKNENEVQYCCRPISVCFVDG